MGAIQLVLVLGATLVLMAPVVAGCGRGSMSIRNNGYRQMVIAVGEDVPETPRLVDRIKEVFTAASQRLYQATRNRAYLAEIKILLPSTWTSKPEYKIAGTEQMDRSEVMISNFNKSAGLKQEGIFVAKATDCGEPGHFMHISPNLLLDATASDVYGPLDKVLVHEFAHLRYGVFDEHPSGDDPRFYHGPYGEVEATRCSRAITGSMYDAKTKQSTCKAKGNLPDENCRFRDREGDGMKGYGSLMYRPYLNHVDGFCDSKGTHQSNLHNPYAPNVHNRRCNGRSVWEVILSHKDFANSKNPPKVISNTTPTFTVLQTVPKRYVLVMDPSRVPNLRSACSNFLLNMVRDGEKVGIVGIAARAYTTANLTVVNEQNRMMLVNAVPRQTSDFSCIGCGVKEAIKVLQRNGGQPGGTAAGGHIIVITIREENKSPALIEVIREVSRAQVIIHSIAYNDVASANTDAIARGTGGRSFLINERTTLDEAFSVITELNQNGKNRRALVKADSMIAPKRGQSKKTIYIDSTLGFNTQFIFTYGVNTYYISIMSPTGKVYLRNSPIVKKLQGICTFTFKGEGETGMWTIRVSDETVGGNTQRISTTVVSQMSAQPDKYPIVAQVHWGQKEIYTVLADPVVQTVYASVSQGYSSVLGAVVKAVIDGPNSKGMEITLEDNGAGPDVHANDGIYSGYFTGFGDNGRYIVKVVVTAAAGTVVSSVRVVGTRPPTRDEETYNDVPTPVSSNLRCESSGGSFTLSNYNRPPGKVYAPGRVTDLRVGEVDLVNRTVQLIWTAPGAELDKGRVSQYEIRYSNDFKAMVENFADQTLVTQAILVRGELNNPSSAKTREDFVIKMPQSDNTTYVFRLVSKDMNGRISQSKPSNLVSTGLVPFKPPSIASGLSTTAIILISIFSVLLLIAIVVAAVIGVRRVYMNKESRPRSPNPLFVKSKPTGKVRPMSRSPVVKTHNVEAEPNIKSNTLNVRELKDGEIAETMAIGETFSESYMNTCTLISLD